MTVAALPRVSGGSLAGVIMASWGAATIFWMGLGATIKSAEDLVHIVTGLFSQSDQVALKSKFAEVEASALSALDRLDAAIDAAEKS